MNYDLLDDVILLVPKDKICIVDRSTGELVWSDILNPAVMGGCPGYSRKNKTLYLDNFDELNNSTLSVIGNDKAADARGVESVDSKSGGDKYDNTAIKKYFNRRSGVMVLDESELLDGYDGVDVELLAWEVDVLTGVCRLDYKNDRGLSMRKLILVIQHLDEVSARSIMGLLNIGKSHAYNYLGAYKAFAEAFRVQMNRVQGKANPWKDEDCWYSKYLEMVCVGVSVRGIAKELGLSESTLRGRVKSKKKESINV